MPIYTRRIAALLLALSVSASLHAQTTTPTAFAWDYLGATVAQANAYVHTASLDGVALAGPVTCAQSASQLTTATCSVPLPAVISPGTHTFRAVAVHAGVERSFALTVDPSKGPTSPGNPRLLTVTVTVTIP